MALLWQRFLSPLPQTAPIVFTRKQTLDSIENTKNLCPFKLSSVCFAKSFWRGDRELLREEASWVDQVGEYVPVMSFYEHFQFSNRNKFLKSYTLLRGLSN